MTILADPAAMHRAVLAVYPELAGAPVTVHDGGWDSVAIEVGPWLCKFPRDAEGFDALRREAALLGHVRPRLTMAVPDMTVVDGPPLFTRHRMLIGDALSPAGYAALDDYARMRLASDVAGFLAELHEIEADWEALGVGPEEAFEPDIAAGLALLAPERRAAAERMLADHAALGPDPLGTGLCHLDAYGRNFAFADGRLNGIFDFGDAAIADRHEEFVEPAHVGRDCAARVIAAYEERTGHAVDRARVETLIGFQRLIELADDAEHPTYGEWIRMQADDWFARPAL